MKQIMYQKKSLETYNIYKLPEDAELNIKDLLVCTGDDGTAPKDDCWLPSDCYYQKNVKQVEVPTLSVCIVSKFIYAPENPADIGTAFLIAQKNYTFISGKLRIRIKRKIDSIAVISAIFSLVAIIFSIATYFDQKYELDIAKNPIWIIKYNPDDVSLSFKSASEEIQLQSGFVMFSPSKKISGQHLFMPEMKVYMYNFNKKFEEYLSGMHREKKPYVFGNNQIFETIAVATQYTYKGELRIKGALYDVFYDLAVPGLDDKKSFPKILIQGAAFRRFLTPEETLDSALHNKMRESTENEEWVRLLNNHSNAKIN